uniref:Uncharacterized protein n=1 Tax=Anguilla anguilla TaxID=7936 RepID=A0A0E9W1M4_ANGAN
MLLSRATSSVSNYSAGCILEQCRLSTLLKGTLPGNRTCIL